MILSNVFAPQKSVKLEINQREEGFRGNFLIFSVAPCTNNPCVHRMSSELVFFRGKFPSK